MTLTSNKERHTGFTLIELMISISILSILLLVVYGMGMNMLKSQRILDSKVRLRDESRIAAMHIMRNLRLANTSGKEGITVPVLQYFDDNDDLQNWPPLEPVDNIVFYIPVDLDLDGFPVTGGVIDWSPQIIIQLDVDDINEDGKRNQIVQIVDGDFSKVLASDIDVINEGTGIFSGNSEEDEDGNISFELKRVNLTINQRADLGANFGEVVTRYDDSVLIRN